MGMKLPGAEIYLDNGISDCISDSTDSVIDIDYVLIQRESIKSMSEYMTIGGSALFLFSIILDTAWSCNTSSWQTKASVYSVVDIMVVEEL